VVGCYEWEKGLRRELSIAVSFPFDCRPAGESDELGKAFDYEPLVARLVARAEGGDFDLVEALAETVARTCLDEFGLPEIRVSITKREALPALDAVVVEIERRAGRRPGGRTSR
jgi:dihydroneopterin aldolase